MRHKFEIFSGGCNLCRKAIDILKNNISKNSEIVEYNLQHSIQEEIQEKIKKYDVTAVPSIIVDEKYKIIGIPEPSEIRKFISDI
ncbi:MAG: thioredoxin family protein [Promethearchaeota archaeon]|jgi:glutaredoxin